MKSKSFTRAMLSVLLTGSATCVTAPAETAFGIDITPLGAAMLSFDGSRLVVSNIGASGNDGVRFNFVPTDAGVPVTFLAGWEWWDPGDSLPIGARFTSELFGEIVPGDEDSIGLFQMRKSASSTYPSSLTLFGTPADRVEIRQGSSVNVVSGVTGEMIMVMDIPAIEPSGFLQGWGPSSEGPGGIPIPDGQLVFCGTLFECEFHGWNGVTTFFVAGSIDLDPTLPVDIASDVSAPAPPIHRLTGIEYTFAGVPSFTFLSAEVGRVPEPASVVLAGVGLLVLAGAIRARAARGRES